MGIHFCYLRQWLGNIWLLWFLLVLVAGMGLDLKCQSMWPLSSTWICIILAVNIINQMPHLSFSQWCCLPAVNLFQSSKLGIQPTPDNLKIEGKLDRLELLGVENKIRDCANRVQWSSSWNKHISNILPYLVPVENYTLSWLFMNKKRDVAPINVRWCLP